jgi:hypothetical protein
MKTKQILRRTRQTASRLLPAAFGVAFALLSFETHALNFGMSSTFAGGSFEAGQIVPVTDTYFASISHAHEISANGTYSTQHYFVMTSPTAGGASVGANSGFSFSVTQSQPYQTASSSFRVSFGSPGVYQEFTTQPFSVTQCMDSYGCTFNYSGYLTQNSPQGTFTVLPNSNTTPGATPTNPITPTVTPPPEFSPRPPGSAYEPEPKSKFWFRSKYPPAKPGALGCEPLEAAGRGR